MFVPRRVYERIGVYDSSMRYLGDYDFMYRAVNVHKLDVIYVPEPVAFYREGGCSDRHIAGCLRDELKVKLRYGQNPAKAKTEYFLKLIKNLPRILLAK
jgi:GT2 family glycosyltransferase